MLVLTAAEMQQADALSVAAGVAMAELMERAGEAVAAFCQRQYPLAAHVLVICGAGNNGGDGLVAARLLAAEGVGIRVLLAGTRGEVKGEAAQALRALVEATGDEVIEEVDEVSGDWDGDALAELIDEADLLIDAVVGTGFRPPLRGAAALLVEAMNRAAVPVVAVDLPSGWDADSQAQSAEGACCANAVVTFTTPKPAHVFGQLTGQRFGPVVVADIGSPAEAVRSEQRLSWTGTSKRLTEALRPMNSNKGRFGHVLVVGGSYGTAGAPSMAALACMRAGAGLVTAAVPREIVQLVGGIAPELMVRGLQQGAEGSAAASNVDRQELLAKLLKGIKVVAVGPGLSTEGEAPEFARGLVAQAKDQDGACLPMVVDADALNAFAGQAELLDGFLDGQNRTLVLTPHPGEMARLLGTTVKAVESDRIGIARGFATAHRLTLVLKGWRTLIAHPDGRVAINTTGNPALAKGGSGDILTGIIAALLAQWPDDVAGAVEAAVYLHGMAADLAVQTMDEKAVLATDVIGHLSAAFGYRTADEDGFEWICGLRSPAGPEGAG